MKRPACVFCFTGLLTQLAVLCLPQAVFWPLAAFCAVLAIFWYCCTHSRMPLLLTVSAVLSLVLCLLAQQRFYKPAQALDGKTLRIEAVITQAETSYVDGMYSVQLQVSRFGGEERSLMVTCPSFPDGEIGDTITAIVELHALSAGAQNYSRFADGVFLEAEYLDGFRKTGTVDWLHLALRRFGLQMSGHLRYYASPKFSGILTAMTTGDRRFVTPTQTELFRKAGVSHILVVSGLHVSILCGIVFSSYGSRLRRLIRACSCILVALFMMMIVGFTPSVTRAGVAAIILNAAVFVLRPKDSLTALACAVFGMSALNPYAVCDLSLQLSFAATLGVLYGGEITEVIEQQEWTDATTPGYLFYLLLSAFIPSAMAAVFTFPILVFWGMSVSWVGLAANLFLLWLIRPIILCGMIAALAGFVPCLAFAQCTFSLVGAPLVRLLLWLVERFASVPGGSITFETPFAGVVMLVLMLFAVLVWRAKLPKGFAAIAGAAMLCFSILLGSMLSHNVLRVVLVGNSWSPAVVITRQDAAAVLYRGSHYNYVKVKEYLDRRGIAAPDLVIDLRYSEKKDNRLQPAQTIRLAELEPYDAQTVQWNGITFSLQSTGDGGAVWMDLGGMSAAVISGSPVFPQPVQADFLLAASSNGAKVQAETVLTLHHGYEWLDSTPASDVYYGHSGLTLAVRPYLGYRLKGVNERWQRNPN